MHRIVKRAALATVALGLMVAVSSPVRAAECCSPCAVWHVAYHHCHYHHGCCRPACCAATPAPACACTTPAPVVTATLPACVPYTPCCTVRMVCHGCRIHCRPRCGRW
jgi:hypothetical protein